MLHRWLQSWRKLVRIDRGYMWRLGGLAVVYFVMAKVGLAQAYTTAQITAVWPASGIALVAVFVLGYQYWPGVLVGAFVANILTKEPALVAAGIAVGNTLEAVVGAFLLKRLIGFTGQFTRPRLAAGFALACGLSVMVAATIGSASLAGGGLIPWSHFGSNWLVYWSGDLLGDLLVATFLFVCLDRRAVRRLEGRWLEAGALVVCLLGASVAAFTARNSLLALQFYVLLPFMVWAALRFTKIGVAAGTLVVAAVAIWATVNGLGEAGRLPADWSLVSLLAFVFVVSETMLLLAMAIDERIAAEAALQAKAEELARLQEQLKDSNRRVTGILETVLDNDKRNGAVPATVVVARRGRRS